MPFHKIAKQPLSTNLPAHHVIVYTIHFVSARSSSSRSTFYSDLKRPQESFFQGGIESPAPLRHRRTIDKRAWKKKCYLTCIAWRFSFWKAEDKYRVTTFSLSFAKLLLSFGASCCSSFMASWVLHWPPPLVVEATVGEQIKRTSDGCWCPFHPNKVNQEYIPHR